MEKMPLPCYFFPLLSWQTKRDRLLIRQSFFLSLLQRGSLHAVSVKATGLIMSDFYVIFWDSLLEMATCGFSDH